MVSPSSCCIVSVGVDYWYPKGIDRLIQTLDTVGYTGGRLFYKTLPDGSPTHAENPYAFKIYALQEAINKGYTHILWLDASIYAVKNPMRIFEIIDDEGFFVFRTGYNLAQTATDKQLEYFELTRDEAEAFPEYASGCVGMMPDYDNVFRLWKQSCKDGMFKNSRTHNINDSKDPRFLFGRQDQSALSCALNYVLDKPIPQPEEIAYNGQKYNEEKIVLLIQGM